MIVATRGQSLGLSHRLNLKEIARTSRLVSMLTGYPVQPNKAVVGANAFAHESGIHQHGVLSQPRDVRDHEPARRSGSRARRSCWASTPGGTRSPTPWPSSGLQLEAEALNRAFARFKELADRKISLTDADLEAIVAEELGALEEDAFSLESLAVAGGTHLSPTATVRLRGEGGVRGLGHGRRHDRRRLRGDRPGDRRGREARVVQRLGGDRRQRRARRRRRPARRRRPPRDRARRRRRRRRGERPRVPGRRQPRPPRRSAAERRGRRTAHDERA